MQFREVVGHDRIKSNLIKSVKTDRIPSAQMFLGLSGHGGLTLALAFSQFILCQNKTDVDSCGACSTCLKCEKLVHPDLHLLFPITTMKNFKVSEDKKKDIKVSSDLLSPWRKAVLDNPYLNLFDWYRILGAENKQGQISVEDCNELVKKVALKPYESSYKVVCIWMADKLNTAAANKLLMTIEEPPEKTVFILMCENAEKLPATVISRTQIVKIPRLNESDIIRFLESAKNLDPSNARVLARLSDGNIDTAIQLISDGLSLSDESARFQQWMRLCFTGKIVQLFRWIEEVGGLGRESQKKFLKCSLNILRDCIVITVAGREMVKLPAEELKFVTNFAPYIGKANYQEIVDEVNKAYYHLERNANPKILFADLSLTISSLLRETGKS